VLNALQALPRREYAVTVDSRFDKDKRVVMIRVADEGTGISPEVFAHITEPFFSTKLDSGGTGLGAYISHSIIRGHGGSLEFESKEGHGTTAIISLPVGTESCEREK
jgi:signal transduction histidine kinase